MAAPTAPHTTTAITAVHTGQAGPTGRPLKGVVRMSDTKQVQAGSELAALRARLTADVDCPRCGENDPWQRCRDAD